MFSRDTVIFGTCVLTLILSALDVQAQVEQEQKVLEIFLVVLYHKVTQEDSHLKTEKLLVVEEVE